MRDKDREAFKDAARPMAEFLARYGVRDNIHDGVLADLYDLVNDIRDAKIKAAQELIKRFQAHPDFYQSADKQTAVMNLQRLIDEHTGVV